MAAPESELGALLRALRTDGLRIEVDPDTGSLVVAPRGDDGPTATLDLPEELLGEYLDELGRSYAPFDDVPRDGARGLVSGQIADELTADHGGGVNQVRRLSLVRDAHGVRAVQERADDPGSPPADGPHDEPEVFAAEIGALAGFLGDQGLDAIADPENATLHVGPAGRYPGAREVTVELRPDLYRRHLDAQEEEYEAIGGNPREHAWTAWCRRVVRLLVDGLPGSADELRRVSFVESPDGEVGLAPDAVGTEPPEARYRWSADPGR